MTPDEARRILAAKGWTLHEEPTLSFGAITGGWRARRAGLNYKRL